MHLYVRNSTRTRTAVKLVILVTCAHSSGTGNPLIIKPQFLGIPTSIPDSRKSGEFTVTLYSDGYVTRSSTSLLRTTARLSFRTESEIIGDETNLLCGVRSDGATPRRTEPRGRRNHVAVVRVAARHEAAAAKKAAEEKAAAEAAVAKKAAERKAAEEKAAAEAAAAKKAAEEKAAAEAAVAKTVGISSRYTA